jgi:hypothetical protein
MEWKSIRTYLQAFLSCEDLATELARLDTIRVPSQMNFLDICVFDERFEVRQLMLSQLSNLSVAALVVKQSESAEDGGLESSRLAILELSRR